MEGPGLTYAHQLAMGVSFSFHQYRTLFDSKRLKNAVWSACTVALAQQFSGINVFAFYSSMPIHGDTFLSTVTIRLPLS